MHPLAEQVCAGDLRAVARALTRIENGLDDRRQILADLYPHTGRAHVVGFTGAPGAGKSTLVDRVITSLRAQGLTVAVLAVDPSSPFSGGALLGDRVRMIRHSVDAGVFIRSMSNRGSVGGLGAASRDMLVVLEAANFDVILLETVGVGQAELDVLGVADTVALVLTPGAGDHVQTAKSGIIEIADLLVVNKADLPGAKPLVRELQLMVSERLSRREQWDPPVIEVSAARGEHIDKLLAAVLQHRDHLRAIGLWQIRRRERRRSDVIRLLQERVARYLEQRSRTDQTWITVLDTEGPSDPFTAAERLAADLPFLHQT